MTTKEKDAAMAREVLIAMAILGLAALGWAAYRLF